MKDVRIEVRKIVDAPGNIGTSVEVRLAVGKEYDKWCGVTDIDNKACKIQLCESLLQMLEGASKELAK